MQRFRAFANKSLTGAITTSTAPLQIRLFTDTKATRVTWPNPDVPLSQAMGHSYRPQHTVHVSEIESEISRAQGLVKSVKAMTRRIEKHVEERDDGRRLSGPLYRSAVVRDPNARTRGATMSHVPASLPGEDVMCSEEVLDKLRVVNKELMEAFESLSEVDGKFEVCKRAGQRMIDLDAL